MVKCVRFFYWVVSYQKKCLLLFPRNGLNDLSLRSRDFWPPVAGGGVISNVWTVSVFSVGASNSELLVCVL